MIIRLQWSNETHEDFTQAQLNAIQDRTLLVLEYWISHYYDVDFQPHVELTTRIRFALEKLSLVGLRNFESNILLQKIMRKFGMGLEKRKSSLTLSHSTFNFLKDGWNDGNDEPSPEEIKKMRHSSSTTFDEHGSRRKAGKGSNIQERPSSTFFTAPSAAELPSPTPLRSLDKSREKFKSVERLQVEISREFSSDGASSSPDRDRGKDKDKEKEKDRKKQNSKTLSLRVSKLSSQTKRMLANAADTTVFPSFILQLKTTFVTQQLCLFEQKHYLKLQKYELSELAWSKKKTHYQARHVVYLINRFNEFSRWIVYEVLRGPNQELAMRQAGRWTAPVRGRIAGWSIQRHF